jgi:two-component system sensor histidine kinase QseC
MRSRDSILWAVLRSTLWPFAIALPLLAFGAWWVVSRSFEPLRNLRRKLAQRRPQDLTPIELTGASVEMLPMIEALNGLFGRIANLLESERRFTADAAHELRTPIAAIRAQAQVAMAEADPALRQHALQSTLDGCDRAARLVTQMLTLSRLETVSESAMQDVDLGALAGRIAAELAARAREKGQQLELQVTRSGSVAGDETLLAVLMRNLIDNAIRYSPGAARVQIDLREVAGRIVLSVQDSGAGMSEADRQRLGERFFRVSGSSESGSGLGWSIVRRIAAVHRLDLKVEASAELGGLAVRVAWPLQAASA